MGTELDPAQKSSLGHFLTKTAADITKCEISFCLVLLEKFPDGHSQSNAGELQAMALSPQQCLPIFNVGPLSRGTGQMVRDAQGASRLVSSSKHAGLICRGNCKCLQEPLYLKNTEN